jgi:hypothetical protein
VALESEQQADSALLELQEQVLMTANSSIFTSAMRMNLLFSYRWISIRKD